MPGSKSRTSRLFSANTKLEILFVAAWKKQQKGGKPEEKIRMNKT